MSLWGAIAQTAKKVGTYIVKDDLQKAGGTYLRSQVKSKGFITGVKDVVKDGGSIFYENAEKRLVGVEYTNIAGKAIKEKGALAKDLYKEAIDGLKNIGVDVTTEEGKKLIGKEMIEIAAKKGVDITKSVGKEALEKAGKEVVEEGGKKILKEVGENTVKQGAASLFKGFAKKIPLIGTVITAAFEVPNIINAFKEGGVGEGVKQIGRSAVSVAGDLGGMALGATIGSAIFPPIGTIVGGIIGSLVAGQATDVVNNTVFGKPVAEQKAELAEQQQEQQALAQQGQSNINSEIANTNSMLAYSQGALNPPYSQQTYNQQPVAYQNNESIYNTKPLNYQTGTNTYNNNYQQGQTDVNAEISKVNNMLAFSQDRLNALNYSG